MGKTDDAQGACLSEEKQGEGSTSSQPVSFMVPEEFQGSCASTTPLLKTIPCSKRSYEMTEDTDGFFETYTCCIKRISLREVA